MLLCDVYGNMRVRPGQYHKLCTCFDQPIDSFNKVIVLDLKRTGGDVLQDDQRELLRRVLTSYAKYNQEVGYCQGFNFVAHFLFKMEFTEEQIFWLLCHFFDSLMPPNYYIQMIPVIADLEIFKMMFRFSQRSSFDRIESFQIDLNFFFIPCFVTLFTNLNNEPLIAVILDFFLAEGPIAFIRTGLVLLKQMRETLKNITDAIELNTAFDSHVRSLQDTQQFKRSLCKLFMNAQLLDLCRQQNIESKQHKHNESMSTQKIRTQEKCTESSPYCHWERNLKFKDFQDSVMRCSNLPDCLKFNYFDPFDFTKHSKPYDYLCNRDDQALLSGDKFSTHSHKAVPLFPSKQARQNDDFDSEEDTEPHNSLLEMLVNRRERAMSSIQKSFCVPKSEPPKEDGGCAHPGGPKTVDDMGVRLVTLSTPPKPPSQVYFDNLTVTKSEQPRMALTELKKTENELVIRRCSHICHFEKFEYEVLEMNQNSKRKYFMIVNCILFKHLGRGIEEATGQTHQNRAVDNPFAKEDSVAQKARRIRLQFNRDFGGLAGSFFPRSSSLGNDRKGFWRGQNSDSFASPLGQPNTVVVARQHSLVVATRLKCDFEGQGDVASLSVLKTKYKNAYFLNQEALKRDIQKASSHFKSA
jgi:hypothetical protein